MIPVVTKVLWKPDYLLVYTYLGQNNLLYPHQDACHCGNLLRTFYYQQSISYVYIYCNKGNVVYAAFIDLKKAFNSLYHFLLLQWTSKLGVYSDVVGIICPIVTTVKGHS